MTTKQAKKMAIHILALQCEVCDGCSCNLHNSKNVKFYCKEKCPMRTNTLKVIKFINETAKD